FVIIGAVVVWGAVPFVSVTLYAALTQVPLRVRGRAVSADGFVRSGRSVFPGPVSERWVSGRPGSRGYGGGLTGTLHQRGGGFCRGFVDLGQQAQPGAVLAGEDLAEAEAAGHNAATVLGQALDQRTLDDAHSPAHALTWRPSAASASATPLAPAPRASSATHIALPAPIHPPAATPPPQAPPVRRR
ncbi:hypothetical protein AB0Q94_31050, partial [Streptomyces sp. NPDC088270]